MLSRLVKPAILLFWAVMLGLLIHRSYIKPVSVIALDIVTEEGVRSGDEWFGIYQQGRKIGYAHIQLVPEGSAYRISEESELDIRVLDTVQRVTTTITSYTTTNFLLKYFDFTLRSPLANMTVKGAVVKKDLVLDIISGGQTRKEHIKLAEPPYLSPNVKPALVLMGLEPGRKYRFPLFNPATMSTEDATVTVEGRETIKSGDRELTVYKLRETFQGMESFAWISEEGETIKEVSPLGYTLLRESPAEAKRLDKEGPAVDIIELTRVPSDPIPNAATTNLMKAQLSGVALAGFELDGGRQELSGDVVTVRSDIPASTLRLPVSDAMHSRELSPTPLVQSDDDEIRSTARSILRGERDAAAAAKKLNEWLYTTLRKQPVVSIPSAVEVLKQRVGDCNEHTTLYTALARSAGLPARMAAGVVYLENGFYYHAWPEVWLGAWVAVDPTFGQFPADATHIRFRTGDLASQTDIMRLVGKLKIKVLETK